MTSSTLVSFRHVRKSWQQVTALQNFSLDIAAGELVALVGSSGCGKSTLLRMLVGLESATQGEIRINGEPVTGVGKERGIVFQEPRLMPWLTVWDNTIFGLKKQSYDTGEIQALLETVGLDGFQKAYPHQLSGGMQQRTAIARALAYAPSFLLMDEPFQGLDEESRKKAAQCILEHQEGRALLVISHEPKDAELLKARPITLESLMT